MLSKSFSCYHLNEVQSQRSEHHTIMETQTHAFPSDPAGYQPQQGLTKREYFAALAMQSLIDSSFKQGYRAKYVDATPEEIEAAVAEASVMQADALLAALQSTK